MADNEGRHADLLSRAAVGDREAFRSFYEETAGYIFSLGLRMLGDRARAEDLLQEVYLRAWYRASDYQVRKGEPLSWLVTIARNKAIDMGRGAAARDLPLDIIGDEGPMDATTKPPAEDEPQELRRCLGELEAGQRQCVFAAFYQGLSHGEIAARLDTPLGTVKTNIRRGLAALRRCLGT